MILRLGKAQYQRSKTMQLANYAKKLSKEEARIDVER